MRKKTLGQLKKIAWKLFSQMIRLRVGKCVKCGSHEGLQAHHIIPRARGNAVYFLRDNILVLCSGCHLYGWHTKWSPKEKQELIEKVIGKKKWKAVEGAKNITVKISKSDYEEMIEKYKKEIRKYE